MYTHYERSSERASHDYDRVDDSYDISSNASTYRSAMSPRVTNLPRSRPSALGSGGGGVMTRVFQSFQSTGSSGNFGPGLASIANFPGVPMRGSSNINTALVGFNSTRQRDKKDLEQLNDKFAQYVEKVRFLEAQNRKLQMELEALQNRSGQGSSRIKEMYDIEMSEAKRLIDDTKRDAAAANVKTQQAEQDVRRQRDRYNQISGLRDADRKEIDSIQRQIAENEAQINLFRRRLEDLDDESRRYKTESQRLTSEINRLQNEIQNERFTKSSCDVEKYALEDELAFLKQTHEANLAELRSRSVSNDLDPSQFFRNELSQAIREIRNDYETRVDSQRNDMQNKYSILFNEIVMKQQRSDANPLYNEQHRRQEERIRSEVAQTQNQNAYLRAQTQGVKNRIDDLQRRLAQFKEDGGAAQSKLAKDIQDAKNRLEQANRDFAEVSNLKTSLEKEISVYRDLLESQSGLRGYVDRIVQNAEQQVLERPSTRPSGVSTSIQHTFINTTGSNSNFGGSPGGISSLINQSTRPSNSYQTISSGIRNTLRDSNNSDY